MKYDSSGANVRFFGFHHQGLYMYQYLLCVSPNVLLWSDFKTPALCEAWNSRPSDYVTDTLPTASTRLYEGIEILEKNRNNHNLISVLSNNNIQSLLNKMRFAAFCANEAMQLSFT